MKVRQVFFKRDRTGAQWGRHLRQHKRTRTLCGRSVLTTDRWTRKEPDGAVHDCARCQAVAARCLEEAIGQAEGGRR